MPTKKSPAADQARASTELDEWLTRKRKYTRIVNYDKNNIGLQPDIDELNTIIAKYDLDKNTFHGIVDVEGELALCLYMLRCGVPAHLILDIFAERPWIDNLVMR